MKDSKITPILECKGNDFEKLQEVEEYYQVD